MKRRSASPYLAMGSMLTLCFLATQAYGATDHLMCGAHLFDRFHAAPEHAARPTRLDTDVGEPFVVRSIYFVPSDGPFHADVPAQMDAALKQTQIFFADQMEAHGYGRKTFRFEADSAGTAIVYRVDGQFPDSYYLDDTIDKIRAEIEEQFSVWDNLYLIAVEISSGKLYKNFTGIGLTLGPDGGMAFAARPSLSFGLIGHELGHAFGMPHDFRDDLYLMSYGSNKTLLSPCTAELLDASRFFIPDGTFSNESDTEIRVISPPQYPAGASSVTIRFELSDSDGLHQAQLLSQTLPPHLAEGGFEVKECTHLDATDTIVEFVYDGNPPSSEDANLSQPFVQSMTLTVRDAQGVSTWKQFTIYADSSSGAGSTYFVATTGSDTLDGGEGSPFATIQKAIDTAQHGDTVIVNDGTYTGEGNVNLDFQTKAIVLRSAHGAAATIIDCENADDTRGVSFQNGESPLSVLDGFTIQHGRSGTGGGILCWESSPIITNCTLIDNTADVNGGGIYCGSSAAPTIIGCTLTGNSAGYGGGMQCWESAPTITNCTFIDNTASQLGGGMQCLSFSDASITDCTFTANTAQDGAGIICSESAPTITNCTVTDNTASQLGGGIFCASSSDATITDCTLTGNTAERGGGIRCWESAPTITNCTIRGNTADANGGGIYCVSSSDASITDCTLTGNAAEEGGGIMCWESSPTITNCIVTADTASRIGGGIYCASFSNASIIDCTVTDNVAQWGGGIRCWESAPTITNCTVTGNTASQTGGGIYCVSSSASSIAGCIITDNVAQWGGGIMCWESAPTITNCTLAENTVSQLGGGIYCQSSSDPSITSCTIMGNTAREGGGVMCWEAAPTFANCTIANNTADTNGGGVYSAASSAPDIINGTITGNSAQWGGGIMCWKAVLTARNTILWENLATSLGNEVYLADSSSIHLTFSDVQGGFPALRGNLTAVTNSTYEDNINADPLFIDAVHGDHRLSAESPCREAGTADGAPDADIQGYPRPFGRGVDIGAHEWVVAALPGGAIWGDATGNGLVTAYDAARILRHTVGLLVLAGIDSMAADVSGDLTISPYDASLVLQYVVGRILRFPVDLGQAAKVMYAARTVRIGPVEMPSDSRRSLPILIDEMAGVVAGEVALSVGGYEGNVTIIRTDLTSDYLLVSHVENGLIRASFAGSESSTGPGPLLEVVFDASDTEVLSSLKLDRVSLNEGAIPVRIERDGPVSPGAYRLGQNHPNPFNPETTLSCDIMKTGIVRLSIYTPTGQIVRRLVDGERAPGSYAITWDGRDEAGRDVASGIYLCRMVAGNYSAVRKMVLAR